MSEQPEIDWSEVIDGNDGLYSKTVNLAHMLHFLMGKLEFSFDHERGRSSGTSGGIDLTFQRDGIDATLWLTGQAWSEAKDLVDAIEALQQKMDAAAPE